MLGKSGTCKWNEFPRASTSPGFIAKVFRLRYADPKAISRELTRPSPLRGTNLLFSCSRIRVEGSFSLEFRSYPRKVVRNLERGESSFAISSASEVRRIISTGKFSRVPPFCREIFFFLLKPSRVERFHT